jgi:hypothetical protein
MSLLRRPRRRDRPAGRPAQAVTEYSLTVFAVLGLGLIGGWNLIPAFISAFQRYFDGFYILLNLPIP